MYCGDSVALKEKLSDRLVDFAKIFGPKATEACRTEWRRLHIR